MGNPRRRLTQEEWNAILELRAEGKITNKPICVEDVRSDAELVKLRGKLKDMRKKYSIALTENDALNKKQKILDNIGAIKNSSNVLHIGKPSNKRGGSESVAIAVASDWHIGETVIGANINGVNDFNNEVAERRVKAFFTKTLELVEIMRSATRVNHLVVALLGDLISGYIHEELLEESYFSPHESIDWLYIAVKDGIEYLLKYGGFKQITIPCCYGNHGRSTAKKRFASASKNSFEVTLYKELARRYDKHKIVKFQVSPGYSLFQRYFDRYTIRYHHGDYMRFGGGVGGISIPINKGITKMNQKKHADIDVFGHFHQFKDGGHWVCNGSLIGYNAFAESINASYEPPRQLFFTIERDRGKTFTAPIFLDE